MKIYICDKCGKRQESHGIVGKEFDYHGKFETLAPGFREPDIVDLCSSCFRTTQDTYLKAKHDTHLTALARAKEWLRAI